MVCPGIASHHGNERFHVVESIRTDLFNKDHNRLEPEILEDLIPAVDPSDQRISDV